MCPFQRLELVERLAGSKHDAGQWGLRASDLQTCFGADSSVDAAEECAAARKDDSPVADVGGKLGRGAFECVLHGSHDPLDRSVEREIVSLDDGS